jgi:hypothetical protein
MGLTAAPAKQSLNQFSDVLHERTSGEKMKATVGSQPAFSDPHQSVQFRQQDQVGASEQHGSTGFIERSKPSDHLQASVEKLCAHAVSMEQNGHRLCG